MWLIFLIILDLPAIWIGQRSNINDGFLSDFVSVTKIVALTLFLRILLPTLEHWMNMIPWKNQTDVINGFDFIRKIEGSVIYEQVGKCAYFVGKK